MLIPRSCQPTALGQRPVPAGDTRYAASPVTPRSCKQPLRSSRQRRLQFCTQLRCQHIPGACHQQRHLITDQPDVARRRGQHGQARPVAHRHHEQEAALHLDDGLVDHPGVEYARRSLREAGEPGRDRGELVGPSAVEPIRDRHEQPVRRDDDRVRDAGDVAHEVVDQPVEVLRFLTELRHRRSLGPSGWALHTLTARPRRGRSGRCRRPCAARARDRCGSWKACYELHPESERSCSTGVRTTPARRPAGSRPRSLAPDWPGGRAGEGPPWWSAPRRVGASAPGAARRSPRPAVVPTTAPAGPAATSEAALADAAAVVVPVATRGRRRTLVGPLAGPAASARARRASAAGAPGTAAPGTAAPGTAAPGTAAPGTAAPGTAAPGTAAPGTAAPAARAAQRPMRPAARGRRARAPAPAAPAWARTAGAGASAAGRPAG